MDTPLTAAEQAAVLADVDAFLAREDATTGKPQPTLTVVKGGKS